jgi:uncharacterized repeat protein (TIGR03803 family)
MRSLLQLFTTDLSGTQFCKLARSAGLLMALVLPAGVISPAQTVNDVYDFSGPSAFPLFVALAEGRDGKLYGTTFGFGINGSVFKVSTKGKGFSEYDLDGDDGFSVQAGLTLATDGSFYGTASGGGSNNDGVLFSVNASLGSFTVLHSFAGGADGNRPSAPPIEGADGSFYGTTSGSITSVGSTVYKYDKVQATFSTIYQFDQVHGAYLTAPLVLGPDGNLYGVAEFGGANNCGTLYKMTTAGSILWYYSFPCGKGGANPIGPLIQASDGNFYGTTSAGGSGPSSSGTVFRLDAKGTVTILYSFLGDPDGNRPTAGLVEGTDGNLYGATERGGTNDEGALYQVTKAGAYTLLKSMNEIVGSLPDGSLVQHTNGLFYGTASYRSKGGFGAVYSLDMGLGPFVTFVRPTGKVAQTAQILGTGLTGTTSVTFNGVKATSFSVVSDTYMTAVVPAGATTGPVTVTTPTQTLTSNVSFRITQ